MFYNLRQIDKTHKLFCAMEGCRRVEQDPIHHPEGDVFNHSLQVLRWAFRETNDIDLIFAAMLHDVGKQVDGPGHEKYSVSLVSGFISEKTEWLILNHMRFWYYVLGDMKKLSKVVEISNHKWFPCLCKLARWDKMGRNPNVKTSYDRESIINRLRVAEVGWGVSAWDAGQN